MLSREAQVALTLRSVLGMTTAQLARAFLVTEATMTKRIVRAKRRIVEARIPFAMPSGSEIGARLSEVLSTVYVLFNEGYLSAGSTSAQREELADDAEWLASLLWQLLPQEPEVIGLLALIRLHQARRQARFDGTGAIILMQDQDRSRWDRAAIEAAIELLTEALEMGRLGYYQAQAAIAGCHAVAPSWADTNWELIVTLYDRLMHATDSPVAAMNRAIAVRFRDGPDAGLDELEPLAGRLGSYHLFHAARAEMLRGLGRVGEAAEEDRPGVRADGEPGRAEPAPAPDRRRHADQGQSPVVIATGINYRRLGVPAVEALVGAGVFYGSALTEAPGLRGEDVVVVGGGNAAGQAAVHLSRFARRVTMVVRGESLAEMSAYLVDELRTLENVTVQLRTQVVDAAGAGQLEQVTLAAAGSDARNTIPAAALFVLIGGEPQTEWLADLLERDEGGYIRAGRELAGQDAVGAGPPLARAAASLRVQCARRLRRWRRARGLGEADGDGGGRPVHCDPEVHEYLSRR